MRRPSLFVSSTCYDLKQLRADLYLYVEQAGLEPVMSEYPSFPVDPDETAIENCRKAVNNRADIFVLVIGGRYGSVDNHGKSVTNLEYITARAKGVPIYVFVMRSILDVLPIWKANPTGDFSSAVDSTELFRFVSDIRKAGHDWVFAFGTAQEIISILRTQLAYLFSDALELRTRASTSGTLSAKYDHVFGRELRLIIERPRGWEYLLFSEALQREVSSSADLKRDWTHNVVFGPQTLASALWLSQFIQGKFSEVHRVVENLQALFDKALPAAFGPPGHPGDPEEIIYVTKRVGDIYRSLMNWKLEFSRLSAPDELIQLRTLAAGLCDNTITEVEQFAVKVSSELAAALNRPQDGTPQVLNLTLFFTVPDQTPLFQEIERLNALVAAGQLDWN
jgi:hypothetical protein